MVGFEENRIDGTMYRRLINHSCVCKAKEGRHIRITRRLKKLLAGCVVYTINGL
jgi:hypothetical protein